MTHPTADQLTAYFPELESASQLMQHSAAELCAQSAVSSLEDLASRALHHTFPHFPALAQALEHLTRATEETHARILDTSECMTSIGRATESLGSNLNAEDHHNAASLGALSSAASLEPATAISGWGRW